MKNLCIKMMLLSGCFILSSCTQPKVYQMSPLVDVDDEVKNKIEERETLNNELSGLSRKGEILDKIHEYQPFIKVLNVYIPGKQLDNGVYEHSRVESVPLVFSNNAIQLSPDSVERAFEDVRKAQGAADTKSAPTNAVQATNSVQEYTAVERRSTPRSTESSASSVPENELIIHKGSNQIRYQTNATNIVRPRED